jgi:hypothetical protein
MKKGKCEGCGSCSCGNTEKLTKKEIEIENEMEKTLTIGPDNYAKVYKLLKKYFGK